MKPIFTAFFVLMICISTNAQYNAGVVIEPMLKTDTTSIGQKIHYPHFTNEESNDKPALSFIPLRTP
ncbi:MAG TPA: hypothetical protein VHO72_10230 [Bacteroidales bacterium]|nr:hypothetical protein [Bacteroidales bacterium]